MFGIRESLLRRKITLLIDKREFYAKKVTIDSDILDNTNDFDFDRLESIWDSNSEKIKELNKEILDVLRKMINRGYQVDDILNKHIFIKRLVSYEDDLDSKLNRKS